MAQLYINITSSSRDNSKAEACCRINATTASRKLNAKTLLKDTAVTTKPVINREQQSKSIYDEAEYQHRVEARPEG